MKSIQNELLPKTPHLAQPKGTEGNTGHGVIISEVESVSVLTLKGKVFLCLGSITLVN